MLQLKGITKDYVSGGQTVRALRGVDMELGASEFVAILGPSGCGKTTLLNIVGGLDRYTNGDLIINNTSTKEYRDRDWDEYRNHRVGFVFQSYNLIPHQTVLANVELALTLSGVSKAERRRKAIEVLKKVGLEDQLAKKPNQLSGGQMQRVAIARALVNDPEIILADEPTGALDSETSVQVLELLRELAHDRLIIMVTHNAELASRYATRIIRLLDGLVVSDDENTGIQSPADKKSEAPKHTAYKHRRHVSMSFFTALSLSLNNLMTKKGRTILTAFAGSIGIIGIALILSISDGFQGYIDRVQEDTLSSYPLMIESEVMDISALLSRDSEDERDEAERSEDRVYSNGSMSDMASLLSSSKEMNDLSAFKAYLESDECDIHQYVNAIQYSYDLDMYVFNASAVGGGIVQANPATVFDKMFGEQLSSMMSAYSYNTDVFSEMIDNQELLSTQYDILAGEWADEYNEVMLITDKFNQIDDYTLYTLGLKDQSELTEIVNAMTAGEAFEVEQISFSYDELLGLDLTLLLPTDFYEYNADNDAWTDIRNDSTGMALRNKLDNGIKLRVVGIVRPAENVTATSIGGTVGYTSALTRYVIDGVNNSEIVKRQLAEPDIDVFTGIEFGNGETVFAPTVDDVMNYIHSLPQEEQEGILPYLSQMTDEQLIAQFKDKLVPSSGTNNTYAGNIAALGITDMDSPSQISLFPKDFASKDSIASLINDYNKRMAEAGDESKIIRYTDYVGLLMKSVSSIIDVISYVLIAFVAVSLIVSSIMIGVITNISVLERTKEIGILRSIGASKRDISRVFNAETLIIGFASGMIGVLLTFLLILPINAIIYSLGGINNVAALPWQAALILLGISMLLTLIAGLVPSRAAAKKDPVVALRTE